MAKFRFIVQSDSGKVRRGTINEADERAARERLESAGFKVVSLTESTDLVVHESKGSGGRTRPTVERAAIIDFEETAGEKMWRLLNTYFLRREAAMILAVVGVIWVVASGMGEEEQKGTQGPTYTSYKIAVDVSPGAVDPDQVRVRFPDLPYTATEDWKGGPSQKLQVEIETTKVPGRVEIKLIKGDEVVAAEDGHLNSAGPNTYSFSSAPLPVSP